MTPLARDGVDADDVAAHLATGRAWDAKTVFDFLDDALVREARC